MIRFKEHKHYSRNFKLGLIVSELLVICAFLYSPDFKQSQVNEIKEPLIIIDDIPITIQKNEYRAVSPAIPEITIAGDIDDPILLDDIVILNNTSSEFETANQFDVVENATQKMQRATPRQLLEVLPDKSKRNYDGSIQLRLKIDKSGKVADHVVLFNSLECEDCLKDIISSVYKSVWEPGISDGKETEFWVEKSYTFN